MSLTKEALQHLEQSHKTGTEIVQGAALVVGQDFRLEDLEAFQEQRRRFRGRFKTDGIADFTAYLSTRAKEGNPVFVDRDSMSSRCIIDLGDETSPGHCEHSATLSLPKTPEYEAFLRASDATFDQDGIVELLEDWGHLMAFENSTNAALELRQVIHAFRKVSIDDLTSLESERQEHSSQASVMSKVTVKHADRLPAVIEWRFAPYEGLEERRLSMRVSTLTAKAEKPRFRLRGIALDAAVKAVAQEFAARLEADLPECECLLGTFNA